MPASLCYSQGASAISVDSAEPPQHDLGHLLLRTEVVTPSFSSLGTANPDTAILVRSFDHEKGALLRVFGSIHAADNIVPVAIIATALGAAFRI
jgi:hypothetical protein